MIATLLLALDAGEVKYFLGAALVTGLPLMAVLLYRLRSQKANSSKNL